MGYWNFILDCTRILFSINIFVLTQVIECRAAVVWAVGEPFKMETIQVATPKAGEVRIKIVASGVCHSDLFFIRGGAGPLVFPCILGHEGAGIVESVGPGVSSVAPGIVSIDPTKINSDVFQ